ncbi:MAG: MarR family transcriptional regulator [Erysipelotrichaceae bacterium]
MEDYEKVRRFFHLTYIFKNQFSEKNEKHDDLSPRDCMMLRTIIKLGKENPVKMSMISDHFHISPAAISQVARKFEMKGWIERIILDSDRRSVYVQVTPQACKMLRVKEKQIAQRLESFLSYLGEEDSSALIRIMEKAIEFGNTLKE